MGDKARAKAIAREAAVPVLPGSEALSNLSQAHQLADSIGHPFLLKAVAGGGGRGMRRVDAPRQLEAAWNAAQAEASAAFGDPSLMIEKLIEGARHVEIQIVADLYGEVIHLGERDCSAQRRHQKIIEEAPCPVVDGALRDAMGSAAVALARAVDYLGVGTVELLLSPDGEFYFIEMNTRLQVEHPVTEMVTGVDLVELQLRIAAGEELEIDSMDLEHGPHAIEARLYAERPEAGFIPTTGTVLGWGPPSGPEIRCDHGLAEGLRVGASYDPMLAKIIARGENREQARRRLVAALEQLALLGIEHNGAFLRGLLEHPRFRGGEVTTDFVESLSPSSGRGVPPGFDALAAALWVHHTGGRADAYRGGLTTSRLRLAGDSGEIEARLEPLPERGAHAWQVHVEGRSHAIVFDDLDGTASRQVELDGCTREVLHHFDAGELWLTHHGYAARFTRPRPMLGSETRQSHDWVVAPTLGRVTEILVELGQKVDEGTPLLRIEAMKIESTVLAPHAGEVVELSVARGDQVARRALLALIAPQETPS
jgi:geranyl-CoA carboxylase alpha subunit